MLCGSLRWRRRGVACGAPQGGNGAAVCAQVCDGRAGGFAAVVQFEVEGLGV